MAHLAAPASIAEIHAAVNTLQAEAHRWVWPALCALPPLWSQAC